jgi:hypothetical protein
LSDLRQAIHRHGWGRGLTNTVHRAGWLDTPLLLLLLLLLILLMLLMLMLLMQVHRRTFLLLWFRRRDTVWQIDCPFIQRRTGDDHAAIVDCLF